MPAILRLVDDQLWDSTATGWSKLVSHLTPLKPALSVRQGGEDGPACSYVVNLRKTTIAPPQVNRRPDWEVVETWRNLMKDDDTQKEGVPTRAQFFGQMDGRVMRNVTPWLLLRTEVKRGIDFSVTLPWVPEVVRIQVGVPVFLEIQLLTGRPIPWVRQGLGPVEDPVLGAEWDVLCLDKRGPRGGDFHRDWAAWYQGQGLFQAFRTVLLYSNREPDTPPAWEDAFLGPETLVALSDYPTPPAEGPVGRTLMQAREHLAWRTDEDTDDDELVMPVSMKDQWKAARVAAELAAGVLILGPSGTGKSAMARLVHRWSGRVPSRFVYANCGAMTRELGRDELYGHLKGAFTGADDTRLGLLSRADGGSLFLDEIHHLDIHIQTALLDVLDRRKFLPLGATRPEYADVRIICGCNDPSVTSASSPVIPDLRNRLFHTIIRLPSVVEYQRDDFRRLVETCWDRLKDAAVEQFCATGHLLAQRARRADKEFEEKKELYAQVAPPRSLFASDRIRARVKNLWLADDACDYLWMARHQLAKSNTRGLIAWLWRGMLRCPSHIESLGAAVLESCSPEKEGLITSVSPLPSAVSRISNEPALAEDLALALRSDPAVPLDFTESLNVIQSRLNALVNSGLLQVEDNQLPTFLFRTFQLLRQNLTRKGVRWEQTERQDAKSAFHNPNWAYRKLFEAALPAFGIFEKASASRYEDYMKTASDLAEQSKRQKRSP